LLLGMITCINYAQVKLAL